MKNHQTAPVYFSLLLLLAIPFGQSSAVAANITPLSVSNQTGSLAASKILFKDKALARKIAISYHHAILEVNYQQGYIIADLSTDEMTQLSTLGVEIQPAAQWNQRYQNFLSNTKLAIEQQPEGSQSDSIPGFSCYPTVEETLQQGDSLSRLFPNLTEWIDIGDSWKKFNQPPGFDLMVLKISNKQIIKDKPKLFIHSSMHAREYAPAALTLDFAKQLLNNYASNPDIQWVLDQHEIHILFQMNPDGRKIAETGILQRKNMNINHCPTGSSTGTIGVDLNRNFAFFWNTAAGGSSGESCNQTFRGISAESEPETQAVSNYIRSLYADSRGPNDDDPAPLSTSGMHLDIHSFSQLILWPYGQTEEKSPNDTGFVALGNKLAWFNNYTPQQSIGLYPTDGTSDSVSYGELGVAAITFELGTSFFQQCSVYDNRIKPDNLKALFYAAKAASAPYFVSLGADITQVELNNSLNGTSVTSGMPVSAVVTANAIRTKLPSLGRTISRVEYSVDTPIWEEQATVAELTENDGDLSSGVEVFSGQISTTNLNSGQHLVYFRAFDQGGNQGVVTASSINIAENASPLPDFQTTCTDLDCRFDAGTSNDSDGSITNYQWDFAGEGNATGSTVSFLFSQAGQKAITLVITDNSANQATKTENITVTAAVPPTTAPPALDVPPAASTSGSGSLSWWLIGLSIGFLKRKRDKN